MTWHNPSDVLPNDGDVICVAFMDSDGATTVVHGTVSKETLQYMQDERDGWNDPDFNSRLEEAENGDIYHSDDGDRRIYTTNRDRYVFDVLDGSYERINDVFSCSTHETMWCETPVLPPKCYPVAV